jgi:hypothetical protein
MNLAFLNDGDLLTARQPGQDTAEPSQESDGGWTTVRPLERQQDIQPIEIGIRNVLDDAQHPDDRELARSSREENSRDLYEEVVGMVEQYDKLSEEFHGRILDWEDLVNELAHQVSTETNMIMLAIDTLRYGEVTVPNAYRRFWSALLAKAASKVSIQIVTYNEQAINQLICEEFDKESDQLHHQDEHFERIKTLKYIGGDDIEIVLSSYFPTHFFIFKSNRTAMFALQEVFGDAQVCAYAVLTHDPVLIEICKRSFLKMKQSASGYIVFNSSKDRKERATGTIPKYSTPKIPGASSSSDSVLGNEVIEIKKRRLQELEKQAAAQGMQCPVHIILEIEKLRIETQD